MRCLLAALGVLVTACAPSGEGYVELHGTHIGDFTFVDAFARWGTHAVPLAYSPAPSDRCTSEADGPCTLTRCEPTGLGTSGWTGWGSPPRPPPWHDAGEVVLVAGDRRFPFEHDGEYYLALETDLPGGVHALEVGGAAVAPHRLPIPWPGMPDIAWHLDDTGGFVFTWEPPPVEVDEMYVGISDGDGWGGGGASFSCSVDAATGSFRVELDGLMWVDRRTANVYAQMMLERTEDVARYPTTIRIETYTIVPAR
jgi:hypothetical protein